MLVAANYTKGWANELMTTLNGRFGRVDRQVTQALVQDFHNPEMLPGESGAQFVERVESTVKQFGEQNMDEKPTENAIIAVLKAAIQVRMPVLFQLVDVHDIGLDKLYHQIVKHGTFKKKSEISPSNATASFISDDYSRYDDQNESKQWKAGADPRGRRQKSGARLLTEHNPDWTKTAEGRKNRSRNNNYWNCDNPNYYADKCPRPPRPKLRDRMDTRRQFNRYDKSSSSHEKKNLVGSAWRRI